MLFNFVGKGKLHEDLVQTIFPHLLRKKRVSYNTKNMVNIREIRNWLVDNHKVYKETE